MTGVNVLSLFFSGGVPNWPPCGGCVAWGGVQESESLPESLTAAVVVVSDRE